MAESALADVLQAALDMAREEQREDLVAVLVRERAYLNSGLGPVRDELAEAVNALDWLCYNASMKALENGITVEYAGARRKPNEALVLMRERLRGAYVKVSDEITKRGPLNERAA